nr:hypothetical protein [Tanacetum cinerariifolium]
MLFDNTMESIRRFVPMESEFQAADSKVGEGSSKECESLKRSAEEELGQEQKIDSYLVRSHWSIKGDHRILEEERESLSIDERSRLLAEFIDKRKKMLATKRAEEKRNKPPTQAQQRTYMSNYLKNMGGSTLKQLKQYLFKEIKMLFDNTMESIRRFVLMESEGQAADSKAGE